MNSFNLCDEPWIQVRYTTGGLGAVSLRQAFTDADSIASIAGELPTQDVALLRLMIAILMATARHEGLEPDAHTWQEWWQDGPPADAVDAYLTSHRHRFDLRDTATPFYQVAGLHTASGNRSGLYKLIGDLPDGQPFFTQRAGVGRESLSAGEAARWLVHCMAFDPSGIKTGAVGDDRVKGGRGYPLGVVAWAGTLGLVVVEGATLRETLLLNLPLDLADVPDDLPVWERPPLSAAVEADHEAPVGTVDLFTWPSRRMLLIWDGDRVVDVQISNGDKLLPQNRHDLEPMTGWRRSPNQEKKLGLQAVYMPRKHDPARQMWRGLPGLLEQTAPGSDSLSPRTLRWLTGLSDWGWDPGAALFRLRVVGVEYGSNESVIDAVVNDALEARVAALTSRRLVGLTTLALEDAEHAVRALAGLAADLADAVNTDRAVARPAAWERGYAALDPLFRRWFATLRDDSDLDAARDAWALAVDRAIRAEGEVLAAQAGPTAFLGRNLSAPGQKPRHMDAGRAWAFFTSNLRKALPSIGRDKEKTA